MRYINLIFGFLALIVLIAACQKDQSSMPSMSAEEMSKADAGKDYDPEFERLCRDRTPNNWMSMRPMRDGKFTSDKSCWGCMSDDGYSHFCGTDEYKEYLENEKQ